MTRTIYFDMDGTIADLYKVPEWLDYLIAEDPYPYCVARPMVRRSIFSDTINELRERGFKVGVISWCAKGGSNLYNEIVAEAKKEWLKNCFPAIEWDDIHITEYGYPKEAFCHQNDILFDDNADVRRAWTGAAYDVNNILEVLASL